MYTSFDSIVVEFGAVIIKLSPDGSIPIPEVPAGVGGVNISAVDISYILKHLKKRWERRNLSFFDKIELKNTSIMNDYTYEYDSQEDISTDECIEEFEYEHNNTSVAN